MGIRRAISALVVPHVIAPSVCAQATLPPAPPPEPPPTHVLHAPQYCTIEVKGGILTLGEASATGPFEVFLQGPVYQSRTAGHSLSHSITWAGSLQVSDQMDHLRIPFEIHDTQERSPETLEGSFQLVVEHNPARRPRSFVLTLDDLDSGQSWQIDNPVSSGDLLDFRLRSSGFTLGVECALSEKGAEP